MQTAGSPEDATRTYSASVPEAIKDASLVPGAVEEVTEEEVFSSF